MSGYAPRPDDYIGRGRWADHDIPLTRAAVTVDQHGRTICPTCGNPAIDQERTDPDEQLCVPSVCAGWQTVAVFNRATRDWVAPSVGGDQ